MKPEQVRKFTSGWLAALFETGTRKSKLVPTTTLAPSAMKRSMTSGASAAEMLGANVDASPSMCSSRYTRLCSGVSVQPWSPMGPT